VTVSVRDARGNVRDREWIESVYRDYLDDLSPLNTGVFSATSLGEIGYSESDQLARWFGDSTVNPLVILRGNEPVGFAMVARGPAGAGRTPVDFRMAEFFVGRTWRRRGIGRLAVELCAASGFSAVLVYHRLGGPGAFLEANGNGGLIELADAEENSVLHINPRETTIWPQEPDLDG
jgi:predicted acetyltransferase